MGDTIRRINGTLPGDGFSGSGRPDGVVHLRLALRPRPLLPLKSLSGFAPTSFPVLRSARHPQCFTLLERQASLTWGTGVGFRKGCRACLPSFPLSIHEQFLFFPSRDWQLHPSAAPAPCPRSRRVWRIAPSHGGSDPFPAKFFDVAHPPLACFSAGRRAIDEPCTFPPRLLARRGFRALRQHIHATSSAIVS